MRLTKRLEDGQAVMDCKNCELKELQMCTALGCRNRLKDRLAEYEDAAANVALVRHGRWISWEEAGNYVPSPDRHECSVCHDAAQVLVNGLELLSDYCPNCGAKMDLEG